MSKLLKIVLDSGAVLFDMDGVVFDTGSIHEKAKIAAIKFCKIKLKKADWDKINQYTSSQIYTWLKNNFKLSISRKNLLIIKVRFLPKR